MNSLLHSRLGALISLIALCVSCSHTTNDWLTVPAGFKELSAPEARQLKRNESWLKYSDLKDSLLGDLNARVEIRRSEILPLAGNIRSTRFALLDMHLVDETHWTGGSNIVATSWLMRVRLRGKEYGEEIDAYHIKKCLGDPLPR